MIIAIDADDVLLAHCNAWLRRFNERAGMQLELEAITDWQFSAIPQERKPELWAVRTPDIYDDIAPMPLAQYAVERLQADGHTLVVVPADGPEFVAAKSAALRRLFDLRDIVFTDRKRAAVRADLLIDDGLHNEPDIVFARPWNAHWQPGDSMAKVAHWPAVLDVVSLLTAPRLHSWVPLFSGSQLV